MMVVSSPQRSASLCELLHAARFDGSELVADALAGLDRAFVQTFMQVGAGRSMIQPAWPRSHATHAAAR